MTRGSGDRGPARTRMAFHGDLSHINLADVFQNLMNNHQTGTLTVTLRGGSILSSAHEASAERHVFFLDGKIQLYSSGKGHVTHLGRDLLAKGVIDAEALAAAEKKRRPGQSLYSVLAKSGATDAVNLTEAIRRHVQEGVCDLFTLRSGTFRFAPGEAAAELFDAEQRDAKVSLEVNGVIMEAARRVDEWSRLDTLLAGPREVFLLARDRGATPEKIVEPDERRVAELLDGRRDVAALVELTGLGRFATFQALAKLIQAGKARPAAAADLCEQAGHAEQKSELGEAARLYRRVVEMEPGHMGAHGRLAAVLEASGDKQGAATEHKLLARLLLDRHDKPGALAARLRAIALVPNDLACREQSLELAAEMKDYTQAERLGSELARACDAMGLGEKACEAYERLLKLPLPNPEPYRRALSDQYLKIGRPKDATRILRRHVSECLASRRDDAAERALRRILELDPKDADAQERLKELETGMMERRRERRRWLKRVSVAGLWVFFALLLAFQEIRARRAFNRADDEAHRLAFLGRYEAVPELFAAVADHHPLTWSGATARRLENEYRTWLAEDFLGKARKAEEAGQPREAKRFYERARDVRPAGKAREDAEAALGRLK